MNPDQVEKLLASLDTIARTMVEPHQYTLTQAADWPILALFVGSLASIIAFMWIDLRGIIKDNRGEWRDELEKHKIEDSRAVDTIWNAMKDCKADCCPARHRE